jgi:hypothetical protein
VQFAIPRQEMRTETGEAAARGAIGISSSPPRIDGWSDSFIYGSSLNAIPLLAEFREHPQDFYLLRVGYAGMMGALTDIDQEGFASAAFHSFPDMLKPDPYSGDYGPNFFGHAWNTATYLVEHPEFGWVAFGGNVKVHNGIVTLTPRDSSRSRIFIAPVGLWLTLDGRNI